MSNLRSTGVSWPCGSVRKRACLGMETGAGLRGEAMRIAKFKHRPLSLYGPLTVLHGDRNGEPILHGNASLRTIQGLLINTRRGAWIVSFRKPARVTWDGDPKP